MKYEDINVKGFMASATAAGLKKNRNPDMALIVSECDAVAAGVFTTNKVKAAPVIISRDHMKNGKARCIIANAGNANACTGPKGLEDALMTARLTAKALGINTEDVMVASTGVIGQPLDMDLVSKAVPDLVNGLSEDKLVNASSAIMTTDSFQKISGFQGSADGHPYGIIGFAKGAGMIMPNMATMLCFILSDINISATDLKNALKAGVESTFNRITVDGDTSTNDMVLILANKMAGNGDLTEEDLGVFTSGLRQVMDDLALMIVKDGEGATKLVNVKVCEAASPEDALAAARNIAGSSLVKTAFFGQDPNWGRIMAALGRSGIIMEENRTDIFIDGIQIVKNGLGTGMDQEKKAAEKMKNNSFDLTVNLHQGKFEDHMFTCDLTHEYVSINADYRS